MKLAVGFLLLAVALVGTACSGGPRPSREETVTAQKRTFKGIPEKEIIGAARQVLVLADGDDFTFTESPNRLVATQEYAFLMPIQSNWEVTVRPDSGGQVVGFATVTGQDAYRGDIPVGGIAVYAMFWERVEYLLGLDPHWPTCDEAERYPDKGLSYNADFGLCHPIVIKDDPPPPFKARS